MSYRDNDLNVVVSNPEAVMSLRLLNATVSLPTSPFPRWPSVSWAWARAT